jgi:hypothetical protein
MNKKYGTIDVKESKTGLGDAAFGELTKRHRGEKKGAASVKEVYLKRTAWNAEKKTTK